MLGWSRSWVRATSMGVPSGVRFIYLSCSGAMICRITILQECPSNLQDLSAAAAEQLQQIKLHTLLMVLKLAKVT